MTDDGSLRDGQAAASAREDCDACVFGDTILSPDESTLVSICWRKRGRETFHACPEFVSDEDASDSHIRERNLLAVWFQEDDP